MPFDQRCKFIPVCDAVVPAINIPVSPKALPDAAVPNKPVRSTNYRLLIDTRGLTTKSSWTDAATPS
jgi:hypothetical protein